MHPLRDCKKPLHETGRAALRNHLHEARELSDANSRETDAHSGVQSEQQAFAKATRQHPPARAGRSPRRSHDAASASSAIAQGVPARGTRVPLP